MTFELEAINVMPCLSAVLKPRAIPPDDLPFFLLLCFVLGMVSRDGKTHLLLPASRVLSRKVRGFSLVITGT